MDLDRPHRHGQTARDLLVGAPLREAIQNLELPRGERLRNGAALLRGEVVEQRCRQLTVDRRPTRRRTANDVKDLRAGGCLQDVSVGP